METTPPLWGAANQADRLAELTARSSDASKEAPLRRDVRSLGILLGRVLTEQAGPELFDQVERLRRLLIQHREQGNASEGSGSGPLLEAAKTQGAALSPHSSHPGHHGFSAYF